jgi:flagellar biosynthetic protein FlhB
MAEESDLERTEPASARRLEQAREEGQVPRSREIGAFLILIVAATTFWVMGSWMVQRVAEMFRRALVVDPDLVQEPTLMLVRLADLSLDALLTCVPLFAALVLAALLSPFFLGSWNFSAKALQPDVSRLDPLKGLARLISWNGLVELVKAVAKVSLLAASPSGSCGASAATCWRCFRSRLRSVSRAPAICSTSVSSPSFRRCC